MKRLLILIIFMLFLVGCGSSDEKIQIAIQQTQIVQMQATNDSLQTQIQVPTATLTPDIPDVPYIKNLTYLEVYDAISDSYFRCSNREFFDDGSYESNCNWNLSGAIYQAKISGYSEDTVFSVGSTYAVYSDDFKQEYILENFLTLVSFSDESEEMGNWIKNNYLEIYNSDYDDNANAEQIFDDAKLMLFGADECVTLLIIANTTP